MPITFNIFQNTGKTVPFNSQLTLSSDSNYSISRCSFPSLGFPGNPVRCSSVIFTARGFSSQAWLQAEPGSCPAGSAAPLSAGAEPGDRRWHRGKPRLAPAWIHLPESCSREATWAKPGLPHMPVEQVPGGTRAAGAQFRAAFGFGVFLGLRQHRERCWPLSGGRHGCPGRADPASRGASPHHPRIPVPAGGRGGSGQTRLLRSASLIALC